MLISIAASVLSLGAAPTPGITCLHEQSPTARLHHATDGRLDRVYGTTLATGQTPEDAIETFFETHLSLWTLHQSDLQPVGPFANGQHTVGIMLDRTNGNEGFKFTGHYWRQVRDGFPVYDTRLMLLVRNTTGNPIVLAAADLRDLGNWHPQPATVAPMQRAIQAANLLLGRDAVVDGDPAFVIWASDGAPRLAVDAVIRIGTNGDPRYDTRRIIVDAHDGTVLLDDSRILNCGLGATLTVAAIGDVSGTIVGRAGEGWSAQECDPMSTQGLPWARVTGGGQTVITDVDGAFDLPGSGNVTVNSAVDGLYFTVNNNGGSNGSVSADIPNGGNAELLHNEGEGELTTAEVNAYIHANECRDFILAYNPQFPVIDNQTDWPINVNIGDTCNAYYDYSSINFYQSGGSCNNTAFGHVVMHEYGHHLVASAGSGQGEYGEGMADCIAVIMTGDSRMGPGFYAGNCEIGIRDADNNCQYTDTCSSCGNAIHACGQLISGCVWSTWESLQSSSPFDADMVIRDLTVNSILLHSGSAINEAIAIDFLTLDDDDADLGNGSPHYNDIALGFGVHNIAVPPLDWLHITLVDGAPGWAEPGGGTTVRFQVDPGLDDPDHDATQFFSGTNGALAPADIVHLGGGLYEGTLTGAACGDFVEWFIWAQTTGGSSAFHPAYAPDVRNMTIAAYSEPVIAFDDDCSTDQGWTVTGDATDGFWERGIPAGGNNRPQTDCDAAASYCWLTENTPGGGGDVDGGSTRLTSPRIDATGVQEVSYCWWYRNIGGGGNVEDDIWIVLVSDDDGSTWTTLQEVGPDGDGVTGEWTTSTFSLMDLADFDVNDMFRIQFVASDLNQTSRVEAAVDNIRMIAIDCEAPPCAGDIDGDGDVGTNDILAILGDWGPDCDGCPADVDGDGDVDVDDLLAVVGAFGPC